MAAYAQARVILEYGSGGSTLHAARQPGKYVISVESDRMWAIRLQNRIDAECTPSPVVVHHVDIGPTGDWGRPLDTTHWARFHRYPTHVWAEPFFRHPDVVLIDGRMRAACFVATFLRISRPVTVLFDDYAGRAAYHVVEQLAPPLRLIGRMAEFIIEPGARPIWMHDLFNELIGDIALAGQKHFPYPSHDEPHYPFRRVP